MGLVFISDSVNDALNLLFIVGSHSLDADFIDTICIVEVFDVVVIYRNKAMLLQDSTYNSIDVFPLIGPRTLARIVFCNSSFAFFVKVASCLFKILIRDSSCIMKFA